MSKFRKKLDSLKEDAQKQKLLKEEKALLEQRQAQQREREKVEERNRLWNNFVNSSVYAQSERFVHSEDVTEYFRELWDLANPTRKKPTQILGMNVGGYTVDVPFSTRNIEYISPAKKSETGYFVAILHLPKVSHDGTEKLYHYALTAGVGSWALPVLGNIAFGFLSHESWRTAEYGEISREESATKHYTFGQTDELFDSLASNFVAWGRKGFPLSRYIIYASDVDLLRNVKWHSARRLRESST